MAGRSVAVIGEELPAGEEGGVKLGTLGMEPPAILLFEAVRAAVGRSVLIHSILLAAAGWEDAGKDEAEDGG